MTNTEILKGVLAEYFKYYTYKDAIEKIRIVYHQKDSLLRKHWEDIKLMIEKRLFPKGQPLSLIAIDANLPLDEDSDEESYKWLNLFIKNIETEDQIIEY